MTTIVVGDRPLLLIKMRYNSDIAVIQSRYCLDTIGRQNRGKDVVYAHEYYIILK